MKLWPLAMGAGMAAGAVTVMLLPKQCTVRKMAEQAAGKVEDAVSAAADQFSAEMKS